MNSKSNKIDETVINSLLQSNDLKDIIKRLVQTEIQNSGNQESAIQKLSDLFFSNNLYETKSNLKPFKHSSIIPINDLRSDKTNYSDEEISVRCSLASLFRLIDMEGWTKSVYNQITMRLPSKDENFYINPFGLLYHEITAGSIIRIDNSNNIIDNGCTILGINKKNWDMHHSIYSARKDVKFIVQLSLPDVVAVSSIKSGLLPVSVEAIKLLDISPKSISGGGVKYHEISSETTINNFKKLVDDLGNSKILFLRNNSLLICGSSIPEVWFLTKATVIACQAQIRLIQLGGKNLLYSECNLAKANTLFSDINSVLDCSGYETDVNLEYELEFEAMMRLLDNAGYRTGHKYSNKKFPPEYIKIDENEDHLNHDDSKYKQCPDSDSNYIENCASSKMTENDISHDFATEEHRIQICPMPPEFNVAHSVEVGYDENDDISLKEHQLVKEICTEIIDNSVKICQNEENVDENHRSDSG